MGEATVGGDIAGADGPFCAASPVQARGLLQGEGAGGAGVDEELGAQVVVEGAEDGACELGAAKGGDGGEESGGSGIDDRELDGDEL